jgi:5-formyltetrahydrofolate cyclo-ligase
MTHHSNRWVGRNAGKDALRHAMWRELQACGAAVGSPWFRIPDFVGARAAAEQLAALPAWRAARVIKVNPDSAQAPVRQLALQQGKRLYMPAPELADAAPFICLDAALLADRSTDVHGLASASGAMEQGRRVDLDDMEPLDFVVVGCVAVSAAGGRTGKGAGFADLELGILRRVGLVGDATPTATTVHGLQLVADERILMELHDTPLDWIATPDRVIATHTGYARPGPLDWNALQPDQYRDIPLLQRLRDAP